MRRTIRLHEALCATNIMITGIDGEVAQLRANEVIRPNSECRIAGNGNAKLGGGRGELIIVLMCDFCDPSLSDRSTTFDVC
jgi:DnaJ-class molecular chaperone